MGRGPLGGLERLAGPSGRTGTSQGTLGEVWDGSGDPRVGPVMVWGPSGRSGMGRGPTRRFGKGRGTLGQVRERLKDLADERYGSGDTQGGPRRIKGLLGRSWTGRETLGEVRDGSWDPPRGPGTVGRPLGRSGMR